MYLILAILAVSQILVHGFAVDPDTITDVDQMRKALKDVLEVNQRLDWQNRRSIKVWSGLLQMCNDLSLTSYRNHDANEDGDTLTFHRTIPGEIEFKNELQTKAETEPSNIVLDPHINQVMAIPEIPLRVISVKSTSYDYLNVTVTYTAPEFHSTDWFAILDHKGKLRSAGNKRGAIGSTFTVYEVFYEPTVIQELHFRLHSDTKSIHMDLSILDLSEPGEQHITEAGDAEFQKETYPSSSKENIEVITTFKESMDANVITTYTHVTFAGLNTSSNPIGMLQYSLADNNVLSLTSNSTDNETAAVITINAEVAQYGGILTVRPPSLNTIGGFILHMYHEQYVVITSVSSDNPIPKDTISLFPIQKQIVVDTEFYSVSCSAMGNPTPTVKLLRQLQTGENSEETVQTVTADTYITEITHTLSSIDKSERIYICRATSGENMVEEAFEVLFVVPVTFDTDKTRAVKDENDTLIITCEAKGYPLPEIILRVNNGTVAPLGSLKISYEVERVTTGDASSLVVTLKKPAFDLPALECVGKQRDHEEILTVYPGVATQIPDH